MFNSRVPFQQLAVFASRYFGWFSIHYLFIFHNIVELNSHFSRSIEADISFVAVDHASHIIHNLFCYCRISSYFKFFINSAFHRISKRDLFLKYYLCSIVVCHNKFSTHTTRRTESRHRHFKDMFSRESIRFTLFQYVIYRPCHIWHKWHHLFFHFQHEVSICCQFKVNIVLFEFVDKYTTKLLRHFTACWDSPIVTKHNTSRTVKAKVKFHICLFATLVCYYEVEFFVLCFNLCQVQAIPLAFFASSNSFSIPIEVYSLFTSQVHNFTCLVFLSRESNFTWCAKFQIQITRIQFQELSHILAPKFIISWSDGIRTTITSFLVLDSRSSKRNRNFCRNIFYFHHNRLIC